MGIGENLNFKHHNVFWKYKKGTLWFSPIGLDLLQPLWSSSSAESTSNPRFSPHHYHFGANNWTRLRFLPYWNAFWKQCSFWSNRHHFQSKPMMGRWGWRWRKGREGSSEVEGDEVGGAGREVGGSEITDRGVDIVLCFSSFSFL